MSNKEKINTKTDNFVSDPEKIESKGYKITNYYYGGAKCDTVIPNDKVLARSLLSLDTGNTVYLTKMYGGELFDPQMNSFSYNRRDWSLKKTNEQAFKLYVAFLKNRADSFRLKAERCINE